MYSYRTLYIAHIELCILHCILTELCIFLYTLYSYTVFVQNSVYYTICSVYYSYGTLYIICTQILLGIPLSTALLLGSLRMEFADIRKLVLSVDDEKITEQLIEQLVKFMPNKEEMMSLMAYKDKLSDLNDAERFGVVVSVLALHSGIKH